MIPKHLLRIKIKIVLNNIIVIKTYDMDDNVMDFMRIKVCMSGGFLIVRI